MTGETVRETTLRELIDTGSAQCSALGKCGGFSIVVRCGATQRALASMRGEVRLFPNLTTLAVFLRKLGVARFEVDSTDYSPARVRAPRPDRAEALRGTRTKPRQASIFGSTR